MSRVTESAVRFGFAEFELDVRSGELRKNGTAVKLQVQPFKVLAFLVARATQVVTRDEICQHVWGGETFVDYEQGLNYCIREIRAAVFSLDRPGEAGPVSSSRYAVNCRQNKGGLNGKPCQFVEASDSSHVGPVSDSPLDFLSD